jgi:hypothetical protein
VAADEARPAREQNRSLIAVVAHERRSLQGALHTLGRWYGHRAFTWMHRSEFRQ